MAVYPYQTYCTSNYKNVWTGLVYGYKGFLLLFCTYLAWETRKVHIPALNDSKQIGFAVYNVFIPCALVIPLLSLLKSHSTVVYTLSAVMCIFCTTITQCLVFVPKVITFVFKCILIVFRLFVNVIVQNCNCINRLTVSKPLTKQHYCNKEALGFS